MRSDLAISIVNHSNPDLLFGCLKSIFYQSSGIAIEVWVVDNATDQRLVPEMRQTFPAVQWLFNSERKGFSANHNQILSKTNARHICILNDDTLIHPGTLDTLVRYLDANPKVAMVGPRLLGSQGGMQDSAFREIDIRFFLFQLFPTPGRIPSPWKRWVDPAQFGEEPRDVAWLLGACVVVKGEALPSIGLLDETLSPIAHSEDIDWCLQATRQGWRVVFVPTASILHYGGMTLGKAKPGVDRMRVELWKTFISFARKNLGLMSALFLRAAVVASLPWNAMILTARHIKHIDSQRTFTDEIKTLFAMASVALFDWSYSPRGR